MTQREMAPLDFWKLTVGYWTTQAIYVAAKLDLCDTIADGEKTSDDLAHQHSANADALHRVMRTLTGIGVLEETSPRKFKLGPNGRYLRRESPESLHAWATMMGEEWFWGPWTNLMHTVKTGETAFRHLFGESTFEYRQKRPEAVEIFNDAMTNVFRAIHRDAIVEAYDYSQVGELVDVGGGHGAMVGAILRANPKLKGVLFDNPHVVEGAGPVLESFGVKDRCRVESGDVYKAVPPGADAYFIKLVMCTATDDGAVSMLENCKKVMKPGGRVLVIERVIPSNSDFHTARLTDLNMMVLTGGRERTEEDYRRIYDRAGFKLTRVIPTSADLSIIEGMAKS